MTAHVQITGYGKSTRTICAPCGHDAEHGLDHRAASLAAAEHNQQHHAPTA